eukprot:gene6140-biopygen5202
MTQVGKNRTWPAAHTGSLPCWARDNVYVYVAVDHQQWEFVLVPKILGTTVSRPPPQHPSHQVLSQVQRLVALGQPLPVLPLPASQQQLPLLLVCLALALACLELGWAALSLAAPHNKYNLRLRLNDLDQLAPGVARFVPLQEVCTPWTFAFSSLSYPDLCATYNMPITW